MTFEYDNVHDLMRQVGNDHVAFLNSVATNFAKLSAKDLEERSGVSASISGRTTEEGIERTIRHLPPEKATDEVLQSMKEAQDWYIGTIRSDGIAWYLRRIGIT